MKKMPKLVLVIALASLLPLVMTTNTYGSDDEMKAELKQARAEIEQLRAELSELKNSSNWKYQQDLRSALKEVPAAGEGAPAQGTFILPAGWTIKPYGYIKFDVSYDNHKVAGDGDLAFYGKSDGRASSASTATTKFNHDGGWSFTARQTRLGAIVTTPDIGELKVRGLVETDFYGNEGAPTGMITRDNVAPLRIRRAFIDVTGKDWMVLAGQEWDCFGPLVPDVFNFTGLACAGNIGYRSPQIQFAKWWDFADKGKFKAQVAVQREVKPGEQIGNVDNGLDSDKPTVAGRLSYSRPSWVEGKRMEIGVGGYIGEQEIDAQGAAAPFTLVNRQIDSWAVATDLCLPITKEVEFQSEIWNGQAMDGHDAGMRQGINTVSAANGVYNGIKATGGWGQFSYKPCDAWKFNLGMGMDDPWDRDISNDGKPNQNLVYYTNGRYYFSKFLWTGLELSYFQTNYNGRYEDGYRDASVFRFQHSWQLSF